MKKIPYTLITAYYMAAIGVAAVSLVDGISPAFVAVMSGAALLSLALNLKEREVIAGRLWNILAIAVFLLFALDYFIVSKDIVTAASRFLTVLLALKLFGLKTDRDYLTAYGIVFFQLLAAAASTVSPVFFLLLVLFIMGGIFALTLMNLKKDLSEWGRGAKDIPPGIFGAPFFMTITAVTAASIVMTFALFFILPRMGAGFFERKSLNTVKVTGFSDRVDLGALGPVKTDPTVVMRVEIADKDFQRAARAPIYFRGTALDYYDGTAWTRKASTEVPLKKSTAGLFALRRPRGGARLVMQRIMLEPLDTEVLFAASRPIMVSGGFSGLRVDTAGSMYLSGPPYSRIEYKAWSDMSGAPFDEEAGEGAYMDTGALGAGTNKKIDALSGGITRGLGKDESKAAAIEEYLKKGPFTYTLSPKAKEGLNPMEDFLFGSKEGYCEHFATAMAVLLRRSGIPSRIVTGFVQGDWSPVGGYYIVRQRDAHSWVEAYIKGRGWTLFDPTPSAGIIPPYRPAAFTLYLDLLRFRWNRYVIGYSFSDQRRFGASVDRQASEVVRAVKKRLTFDSAVSFLKSAYDVFFLLGAAIALFSAWLIKRRDRGAGVLTPWFYIEMSCALRRRGLSRVESETAGEFARRVKMPEAEMLTRAFERVRYGGKTLASSELIDVKRSVEALKSPAKKTRGI